MIAIVFIVIWTGCQWSSTPCCAQHKDLKPQDPLFRRGLWGQVCGGGDTFSPLRRERQDCTKICDDFQFNYFRPVQPLCS